MTRQAEERDLRTTTGISGWRSGRRALIPVILLCACFAAHASGTPYKPVRTSSATPIDVPCAEEAAAFHGVSAMLLRAIIYHESRGNPAAIGRNANGSIDVGLGQMNSIHFPELARHGIAPGHLLNGCVNAYVAAWHLSKQMRTYGNTWLAVGNYHSKTPTFRDRYASEIYAVLQRWQAVP
ncbi:lytic transglycosylase domain-containing protein [Variovorax ginsengisoli]|uniref:Soluble lytic murein transglycosylase-like protein n=1 Tax=Variovorax ginsengisoli TaxID=363844 RepID=A0ABT9SDG0_9BURK|nr:lytic transglycosylase domain-containing protein [Variovorax ginsengisoli]MDP9902394.1 soluble lytic murein transglycosylase-like protein [Variovorax ginsengisoli]